MPLRERAVVAALRVFDGPIATLSTSRPYRGSRHFDFVLTGDCLDADSTLRAVVGFEQETGLVPAAAVPFVDPSLMSGYAVATHFGLPYLALDAIRHSSVNKDLMKQRFAAHGICTPPHVPFRDLPSLRAAIELIGLPCVLKPSGFGGSMGVILVREENEVSSAYEYVSRTFRENYARFSIKNHGLQAEAFCDLPYEVSVEVFNHGKRREAIAVVDKALGPVPFFAEMGHRVPSVHSELAVLRDLATEACTALGLDHGFAHVEIRLDGVDRMEVIEVAARTGGDGILDLVERAFGIAPYECHIRSYLDQLDTWPTPKAGRGVAALAVLKARAGRVVEVRPPPSIPEPVVRYDVFASVGDPSGPPECYEQREGYVECFWPGTGPGEVSRDAHLDLAATLAEQMFQMAG